MASQHNISMNNSIRTYQDNLFDDDDDTLGGICFDLDVQQVLSNESGKYHSSSWCKSSSSSCCSLCRLPAVSEAGDDDSNIFGLDIDANSPSRLIGDNQAKSQDKAVLARRAFGNSTRRQSSISLCVCKHPMSSSYNCVESCEECSFQAPVKSISIPRSCLDSSALKLGSGSPTGSRDYISTSYLPDDALSHIVKFLDVQSLVQLRACNRKMYEIASKDSAGWKDHCETLWSSKANVCSIARLMLAECKKSNKINEEANNIPKFTAMNAYTLSVTDAARRMEICFEEICFDASPEEKGIVWSFRFKESAGRDWTSWDPWWNGEDARKLVFLKDGSIKQVYPQGLEGTAKKVHNGIPLYDVFSERTVQRDGEDVPAPRIEMKWRFVNRPLDLPARPDGAYVRITVGGRDVPTYVVRRSPNGNWGFILESCWGVYASFELASQVQTTALLSRGRRRALRRTRNGSRWVDVDDSDNDGVDDAELERERMRNVRRRIDLFVEESAMTQDGYSQWREALLYNIGAVTLPEGNGDASDEFDHAWQNAIMLR